MISSPTSFEKTARRSVALLLMINMFCYIDRIVLAAILPKIKAEFLAGDPLENTKAGLLSTAFLVSYMVAAPVLGMLADRYSRWIIIGISVALWSLACGASGLAVGFVSLLLTRVFLGLGEGGYGPAAPTILSDLFSVERRGRVLSWFYVAIPVGSAIGYLWGGFISTHLDWRWSFYLLAPPGLILAFFCFFMKDPRELIHTRASEAPKKKASFADYKQLIKIPSLTTNILAQAALTFAIGGLSYWIPTYLKESRGFELDQANFLFGLITVTAGLISTLLGGYLGDRLRKRFTGAYFLVSGSGMLLSFPFIIAMLYLPFPYAWVSIFFAIFFLFLNTGPSNTALANVTPIAMRSSAFALNILVIHALGDAISPTLIGYVRDRSTWNTAFIAVSIVVLASGIIWLCSMKALTRDTDALAKEEAEAEALKTHRDAEAKTIQTS